MKFKFEIEIESDKKEDIIYAVHEVYSQFVSMNKDFDISYKRTKLVRQICEAVESGLNRSVK